MDGTKMTQRLGLAKKRKTSALKRGGNCNVQKRKQHRLPHLGAWCLNRKLPAKDQQKVKNDKISAANGDSRGQRTMELVGVDAVEQKCSLTSRVSCAYQSFKQRSC